jgi:hypothetical protein
MRDVKKNIGYCLQMFGALLKFGKFKDNQYLINIEGIMIYECKVLCSTMEEDQLEDLGIQDPGTWVELAIELDTVKAIKRTNATPKEQHYNATSLFTDYGDTFIVDTPYPRMLQIWKGSRVEQDEEESNLEL